MLEKLLISKYHKEFQKNKSDSCLKLRYQYKDVTINLYFDAFDDPYTTLNVILIYGKDYYFSPLIIDGDNVRGYLTDLPYSMQKRIIIDKSLNNFYNVMAQKISNSPWKAINYLEDNCFKKIYFNKKSTQSKDNLPFISGLRKSNMSKETFERLCKRKDIELSELRYIKENGYTVVRTSDPQRRKKLSGLLSNITNSV